MTAEGNHQENSPSVGQIIKATRIARGLSLESVSKSLCISKNRLTYLEEDHEKVACDVYTLGFLKSYAHFLGLDEQELIQKFKAQALQPQSSHLNFPAPLPGRGMPSFKILGLSLFAIIAVALGWRWFGDHKTSPASQEILTTEAVPTPEPEKKEEVKIAETPPLPEEDSEPVKTVAEPLETPIAEAQPPSVILKATTESWVEVRNKEGEVVVSRLFQPGESYEFKNPQDLVLKTGKAEGIELTFGEKTRTFPKVRGVKSNISLDPEKWVEEIAETQ